MTPSEPPALTSTLVRQVHGSSAETALAPIPRRAVATLSMAAFLSGLSMRVTDALLPMLTRDFAVSLVQAAHVITAFSVAYGVSQLCFGPVGDRYGKYRVIAWACGVCAVTATLCALARSHDQLVATRLLAGATAAAIIPLSMAWIGDVVPYEQRQPLLARFLIGQILGLSAGVFVGGYAADHWTWRVPFAGLGLGFACVSVALFRVQRRLPARARLRQPGGGHAVRRAVDEFSAVLALPWARAVLLTVFLEGGSVYGAFAFIVTHLNRRFAVDLSSAGAVVMLFGFGGLLFALLSAPLVRRLGERGLVLAGGGLLSTSLAAIGIVPQWGWAAPLCFLAGLGFYMMHNTLQTNATQMAPQRRGAAVSAFAACFFLGQAVGVAGAATLVSRLGTRAALAAGGLGVLAVAVNFARRLTRHPAPSRSVAPASR